MKFFATVALVGLFSTAQALKFSSGLHEQAPTVKPHNPSVTVEPASPLPPHTVTTVTTVTKDEPHA